jgi:Na+/melibiose symporter-like transporter
MLELAGYQPNTAQPDAVRTALRVTYIVIPCLSWTGAILIGLRYPLDRRRHEEIRRRIRARAGSPIAPPD